MKARLIGAMLVAVLTASVALATQETPEFGAVPANVRKADVVKDRFKAGEFDYYVFSLSWQPTFCATHQGKKECKTMQKGDFATKNLVLHGLWPSRTGDEKHAYGYCNVPNTIRKHDNANGWCEMPFPQLSRDTIKQLGTVMPGYQSCLENHEWYKHGTCSGMSPDNYFATAARFVKGVAATNLDEFIGDNAGKEVAMGDMAAAAAKDFKGNSGTLRYICQGDMLSEIRLYLKKDLPEDGSITDTLLVAPEASERSSCPDTVRISTFGL